MESLENQLNEHDQLYQEAQVEIHSLKKELNRANDEIMRLKSANSKKRQVVDEQENRMPTASKQGPEESKRRQTATFDVPKIVQQFLPAFGTPRFTFGNNQE